MGQRFSILIQNIRKISVKNRIVFSFYLTSIIPIILIGIISYAIYFNSVKDKISATTTQSLLLSEMNIDMAIERLESNSIEISFSDNAQHALKNYSNLSDFEKFILSLIPYSYLNSETRVISLVMLIIIVICILSAILFSEVISKSIDKPLKTISHC